MSDYSDIADATRGLIDRRVPFTEYDAILNAGLPDDNAMVRQHAAGIIASYWRASKLVRFGPVFAPDGSGKGDYLRRQGRIIYVHADRDAPLATPNGDFFPIRYSNDPLHKKGGGRPKASDRDDFEPWPIEDTPIGVLADAELRRLREENARLREENAGFRSRLERIRAAV